MNTASRVSECLNVLLVEATPVLGPLRGMLDGQGHAVWSVQAAEVGAGEVLELVRPDVALVHLSEQRTDPALAAAHVLIKHHDIPVVLHAASVADASLPRLAALCPRAVLVDPVTPEQLHVSLSLAAAMGPRCEDEDPCASPAELRAVLERIRELLSSVGVVSPTVEEDGRPDLSALTRREREVLDAFVRLRRIPDVADTLYISRHTVRNHLKSIYAKLGVHSQPELMVLMLSGS